MSSEASKSTERRLSFLSKDESGAPEPVDPRRCALMKAQILSLERELLLLSHALSSRKEHMFHLRDYLRDLIGTLTQTLGTDETSLKQPTLRRGEVNLSRALLIAMVEKAHSLLATFDKQILLSDSPGQITPKLTNTFVKPSDHSKAGDLPLSHLVRGGEMALNISAVSSLETNLSKLHGLLSSMQRCEALAEQCSLLPGQHHRDMQQLRHRTLDSLAQCSEDLLQLSFIVPSRCESLSKTNPGTSASSASSRQIRKWLTDVRQETSRLALETEIKRLYMETQRLQEEVEQLQAEIRMHQALWSTHTTHAKSILDSLRTSYTAMKVDFVEQLVEPLESIASSHRQMQLQSNNTTLKAFLEQCRLHMPTVEAALQWRADNYNDSQREDRTFKKFEKVFLEKLRSLKSNC